MKCKVALDLDDYAIDTKTRENKHISLFKCPECNSYTATAMANIAQEKLHEFVPANKLDRLIADFNAAMKKNR